MDVKTECDIIANLCHGCLSTERYVNCINGELDEMFYKLRNGDYQTQCQNLLLCWECIALLKKVKMFQTRIKTAQHLLLQYLQTYYNKDETTKSPCLSSLISIHKNTYNKELTEEINNLSPEQKLFNDLNEEKNNLNESFSFNKENTLENEDNKESLIEDEIILELKQECESNIKVETYYSDNGSEYYEMELKNDDVEVPKEMQSRKKKNFILNEGTVMQKKYKNFAIIADYDNISVDNYLAYSETVQLNIKDYEKKVLRKEKNRYSYTSMPFKCKECDQRYFKKIDLLRHVSLCHNIESLFPRKCTACQKITNSKENLVQHWISEHTVVKKCSLCSEICRTDGGIKRHMRRVHTKTYTCKRCTHQSLTISDFIKHYKSSHETLKCDICNITCRKKKTMAKHMKLRHLPAFCDLCNRTYINHKTFNHHNLTTHPELARVDTRKEMSYCVECDKQYPSVYKYKKHLQDSVKHTPKEKARVPCPDCGKIFTRTSFMNNHYNFVHLKMNKNCCDKCDKKYTTGYGLRKHIERVHNKILPIKDKICDLCGRGFATNKILQNHRRTHTGERPYKCMHCPAAFVQKFAMQTHQKTQHKNINVEIKS